MRTFQDPHHWLRHLDADVVSRLLETAADVVLVLDGDGTIRDVASAADAAFTEDWIGRRWIDTVTGDSRPKIAALLEGAGDPQPRWRQVNHPAVDDNAAVPISYCALPLDPTGRLIAVGRDLRDTASLPRQLVENAVDAVLITDPDGVILHANRSFLDLVGLTHLDQARQQSLDRWLGRQSVDLDMLLANVRRHGSLRLYPTTLRSAYGGRVKVEVSACAAPDGGQRLYGIFVQHVDTRPGSSESDLPPETDQPRTVEQMTELVGQMPLKELVRESTDLIERVCIEAALRLTGDNRAAAAELLGLSRQSLYVKMRRYGLMDTEPPED